MGLTVRRIRSKTASEIQKRLSWKTQLSQERYSLQMKVFYLTSNRLFIHDDLSTTATDHTKGPIICRFVKFIATV